jgi:hypothetical protein
MAKGKSEKRRRTVVSRRALDGSARAGASSGEMRAWLVLLGLIAALGGELGCYPRTCAPADTSCWPCNNPANTNPACPTWPSDTKRPDAGTD